MVSSLVQLFESEYGTANGVFNFPCFHLSIALYYEIYIVEVTVLFLFPTFYRPVMNKTRDPWYQIVSAVDSFYEQEWKLPGMSMLFHS